MFFGTLLFQADASTKSMNLFSLIIQGGPLGIAIFLLLIILSIVAFYIFFERYLTISQASKIDENFMINIRNHVQSGNIDGAKNLCKNADTPIASMVEKGLSRIGKPLKDISVAIENVGNLEVSRLENRLATLATISGAAPMIGFFGTVTGMIMAFYEMASQNNVTPQVLAGGIYQALLTTAFGLMVGIGAFMGYNFLVAKVQKVIFNMETTSLDFMDLLQEPAH